MGGRGASSPFTDGNDVPLEPTFGSNDLANSLVLHIAQRKQDFVVGEGKQMSKTAIPQSRRKQNKLCNCSGRQEGPPNTKLSNFAGLDSSLNSLKR